MCTVTFLPKGEKGFIFTSNRDEQVGRETIEPKTYKEDGVELLFPKDKKAGGTWIGLSDKKRLVCLLNGGNEKHKHTGNYRISRGLVVKESLKAENLHQFLESFNLSGVEPFTLICVSFIDELQLIQLVWDGVEKQLNELKNSPKIWSSSTLYTSEMKQERDVWFQEFVSETVECSQEEILKFHLNDTKGSPETAVKMKRSYVETVSVTSVIKENEDLEMTYINLLDGRKSETSNPFLKTAPVNE